MHRLKKIILPCGIQILRKKAKITSHFTEIAEISILLLNYILAMNKCTYSITKLVLTKYM